jgi:hypothetical protein
MQKRTGFNGVLVWGELVQNSTSNTEIHETKAQLLPCCLINLLLLQDGVLKKPRVLADVSAFYTLGRACAPVSGGCLVVLLLVDWQVSAIRRKPPHPCCRSPLLLFVFGENHREHRRPVFDTFSSFGAVFPLLKN